MVDFNPSEFLSKLNPFGGMRIGFIFNLIIILIIVGFLFYLMLKMMKFKYPVEIFQLNPLRVFKDRGSIFKKDGVQYLRLLKEKIKLTDFKILPAKLGFLGKREKIYLAKDESGDLRPLDIGNISFAFTKEDGQIVDLNECYIEDEEDGTIINLGDADVKTEDGRAVVLKTTSRFVPQNSDVKSCFVNSVMETVQKYHLPSLWQQAQVFLVIMAGLVSAIIIYIINKG